MNKKTLILIVTGFAVAAVGAAIFVLRGSKNSYLNTLPADATAIARMNAKAFLDEAELSMQDFLKAFSNSQEGEDVETGLDLTQSFYAFASPSGNFGLVAAVKDEGDFQAFCESFQTQGDVSAISRQRGYSWAVLKQQWLLAFDSKKALLMGPAVGSAQEQLRGEMARLLEQDRKDSGVESELFSVLERSDEPLVASLAPEILPSKARDFLRPFKVNSRADALLLLNLDIDENELAIETEVLAKSEEVQRELKHLNEVLRPIRGSLLEHTHVKNVAWLGVNLEGSTLLDVLRSNNTIRTSLLAMNLVFDLDRIISSIDGDVTLELTCISDLSNSLGSDNDIPLDFLLKNFNVVAQVNKTDFLNDASSWGNMFMEVETLTPQDFALKLGSSSLFFGVQHNTFYLGGEQGLSRDTNEYLQHQSDDIKGSRFYATVFLPEIISQMGSQLPLPDALALFERLNFEMEDSGDFKLELIAHPGTNIIRELILNK